MNITSSRVIGSGIEQSTRNRHAENLARASRMDEDRIILAALTALDAAAYERIVYPTSDSIAIYIAGAANIPTSALTHTQAADYIRARIEAIRARLSPLVR